LERKRDHKLVDSFVAELRLYLDGGKVRSEIRVGGSLDVDVFVPERFEGSVTRFGVERLPLGVTFNVRRLPFWKRIGRKKCKIKTKKKLR